MIELDVISSEKKISVKSCKALNSKKLIHENVNNILTIILIQILEKMNFNSKNNALKIENAIHMKSDLLILIFSMKIYMMLTIKSDFKISKSN